MCVRYRLPELLAGRKPGGGPQSAYWLAKAVGARTGGAVKPDAIYRIVRNDGYVRYVDTEIADAICDVLDIPLAELFER